MQRLAANDTGAQRHVLLTELESFGYQEAEKLQNKDKRTMALDGCWG